MAWRRRYKETAFVGKIGGSGWRVPKKPDNKGNYLLEVKDDGTTDWKQVSSSGEDYIPYSEKGEANGVATLDDNGKVPADLIYDIDGGTF